MFTKFFLLLIIIQLNIFRTSFSIYYGHQVGHTSMDSTHYDRRFLQQQCSINRQTRDSHQTTYVANFKYFPLASPKNNNNVTDILSFRRQFIIKNEEDALVTRIARNLINIKNTPSLNMDQAILHIIVDKQIIGNLSVYTQVVECVNCPYKIVAEDLSSDKSINLTINTKFSYRLRIELSNISSCAQNLDLYEHGQYMLNVQMASINASLNSDIKCILSTQRSANNIYIPLIVGGIILLILFIICLFGEHMRLRERLIALKNRCLKRIPQQESTLSYDLQVHPPVTTATTTTTTATDTIIATEPNSGVTKIPAIQKISNVIVPRSKRLLSLDAFRGFALLSMIFVNYGGGGYAQFEHAPWHGITFADIVFPFFVWMLGTSLVFSLKNGIDKAVSKRMLIKKIAIRSIKLFIVGFILNTRFLVDLEDVRILGVLQRFAIAYGIIATIEVLCSRPEQYLTRSNDQLTATNVPVKVKKLQQICGLFCDITNFPVQWLINIALAAIWALVVYLVPYEDCPAGYLGPGGLHENGKYENCTGGITGYIDRVIFTDKHLYQYPTCQSVYGCQGPFDPENLFGVLPTIFLAYLGVQAGRILVMYQNNIDRLARLFAWSLINTAIGVGLTAGTLDGGPMPLNKNIWTLSFSFFTAGLAFTGFSLMYIFIDMLKWWNGTPFQYLGGNSILIYILHLVFASYFPVQWIVIDTHAAHLAMNLWGCIFWIIIAYILFKKRIFLVL